MLSKSDIQVLLDVREAVSKETKLIPWHLIDINHNVCALGALVPPEQREYNGLSRQKISSRYPNFEDAYTLRNTIFNKIAIVNNHFSGTDEDRKTRVLNWIEEQLSEQLTKEVTQLPEVQLI